MIDQIGMGAFARAPAGRYAKARPTLGLRFIESESEKEAKKVTCAGFL